MKNGKQLQFYFRPFERVPESSYFDEKYFMVYQNNTHNFIKTSWKLSKNNCLKNFWKNAYFHLMLATMFGKENIERSKRLETR